MIADPETPEKIPFDLASFDAVVFSDVEKRRHRAARKLQIFAGVVVVVAHVAFWWLLQWLSRPDMPRPRDEEALLIQFVTRAPPVPEQIQKILPRVDSGTRATPHPRPVVSTTSRRVSPRSSPEQSLSTVPEFYNSDGSVHIPADVLANLAKLRSDDRGFDFQVPGLARADALLAHRSPLEYRATRFDKDWRPTQDLLTEVLNRAVEASTKEIKIPIPGDPRHHVVCRISLLAMGGGCGVARNGADGDILPGHDDPDTLSAEEDRACQAWWEKIITAKTQDEWRQTRRLYDKECRKPLAQEQAMPETIKAPSGP